MDEKSEDQALNEPEEQDPGDSYDTDEYKKANNAASRRRAIPSIILVALLILLGTGVVWNGIQERTMLETLSRQQSTTQQQETILQAYKEMPRSTSP